MTITFTRFFQFSASHTYQDKIVGHNYVLGVTTDTLDDPSEVQFDKKINEALISKLHSRDLGLHVDFLKGARITDDNLLKIFWGMIKKEIDPMPLRALSLERDSRSKVVMSQEH